jgi:Cu+-exporting ATPase
MGTTLTPDMHNSRPDLATILRDPVCGMTIDSPSQSQSPSHEHDGHNYTFCSRRCMDTFAAAPESYIAAEDPVCGMMVNRASARHTSRSADQRFYFCSPGCQEKFEDDPDQYLAGRPAPEPMPEGTLYTCPMHPEIVQEGPGDCPKCGMALEPMGVPAGDEGPNPELIDFTFRFKVGVVLTTLSH